MRNDRSKAAKATKVINVELPVFPAADSEGGWKEMFLTATATAVSLVWDMEI